MNFSQSYIYQNIPQLLPKKIWKNVKIRRQKLLITLMKMSNRLSINTPLYLKSVKTNNKILLAL